MAYSTPYYKRVIARRAGSARAMNPTQTVRPQKSSENFLSDMDYQQALSGIGQGLSSFAEGQAETYDFSIDPYAGYKGSVKGLAQGGVAGAILGGIGGQAGTFSQVNKNLKKLDTDVDLTGTSATGQPVYMGGSYLDARAKLGSLNEGLDSLNPKNIKDPSAVAFEQVFGTRNKIQSKKRNLIGQTATAQNEFNKASSAFDSQQLALEDYYNRLDMTERLYNLYG